MLLISSGPSTSATTFIISSSYSTIPFSCIPISPSHTSLSIEQMAHSHHESLDPGAVARLSSRTLLGPPVKSCLGQDLDRRRDILGHRGRQSDAFPCRPPRNNNFFLCKTPFPFHSLIDMHVGTSYKSQHRRHP